MNDGLWVLVRNDGLFVAQPGSEHSYTTKLAHARTYPTRAAAVGDSCVENETARPVADLLPRKR